MPSTYDALRKEWMDDGEAFEEVTSCQGVSHKGGYFYIYQPLPARAYRALQYLVEEWDYAYKLMPGFKGDVSWYYEVPK